MSAEDSTQHPREPRWYDHLVGLALCAVYVLVLLRTARTLGYARDEGFYFDAARSYAGWFERLLTEPREALTRPAIDAAWSINHEHPSVMKMLFGLSWRFLLASWSQTRLAVSALAVPGAALGALWLGVGELHRRERTRAARLAGALGLLVVHRVAALTTASVAAAQEGVTPRAGVLLALQPLFAFLLFLWWNPRSFSTSRVPRVLAALACVAAPLALGSRQVLFEETGTSFRFPGMLMAGLCLWLVYAFGLRAWSRSAGLLAAACLALMPRVFYHAHLDCFDVPVMFWWTLVVYCYWRALEGRVGWALATGLAWGVALDVKFNCFLLPVVFLVHWLLCRSTRLGAMRWRERLVSPLPLLSMLLLGAPTFVLLWPWMWFDTILPGVPGQVGLGGRLGEYLGFHWNHAYYNMEFFGFNYFRPPFPRSYPYVMILFTVPATTLALFAVGFAARLPSLLRGLDALRRLLPARGATGRLRAWLESEEADPRGTEVLFFGAGYAILALWWKSDTPIFGGTKHWFTAYPFLALFAGAGFDRVRKAMEDSLGQRLRPRFLGPALLAALCLTAPLVLTAHSHPFGLSNYTPLAGGAPGAADYGMNRQFWGFTTGSVVPWFNENLRPGSTIYIHDTAGSSWEMLHTDGRLRRDLNAAWGVDADASIVHHELHMNEVDYQIWQAFQSPRVRHVLTFDGVPIVTVYQRPRP